MELAIDTSTALSSVAITDTGRLALSLSWHSLRNQTVELLPYLDFLLTRAKVELSGLTFLGVALGPGSFNGIRVGLATAKGLALALRLPLLGVSTLEAMAWGGVGLGLTLCPLLQTGPGQVAFGLFKEVGGRWQRLQEEAIATPEQIALGLKEETVFCGEISPQLREELARLRGDQARFMTVGEGGRAGLVASLCWQRWQRGERDAPSALQPLYLRPPSITLSQEAKNV